MYPLKTDVLLVFHLFSLASCKIVKANYSCCEPLVSPDFVLNLAQSLPQGSVPVIVSDTYHCDSDSGSVVNELQKNSIKIATNSLTFHSLEELQYGVTSLEKTIKRLSRDSKRIFVFTLCFNVARLLPQVEEMYRSFPWVRWVLLNTRQKQKSDYALFQEYPFSSCKIAMSYEGMTGCSSGHCAKRQKTKYIVEGPDIENFNCSKRVKIAKWVDKKFLPGKPNDFLFLSKQLHFSGRKLRVAAVSLFPFFVQEMSSTGERKAKEGIDLKVLELLAEKYNFSFQVVTPLDGTWGMKLSDGEWTGLIGMVLKQEADFALTGIGMTSNREEAVSYPFPYYNGKMSFLMQGPREKSRTLAIIKPFSYKVWVGLFVVVILTSLVTSFLRKMTPEPLAKRWTFPRALWYYCGVVTLQDGGQKLPVTNSLRVIILFYWIFVVIIMTGFSGSLISYMNLPEKEIPVDTISELIKRMEENVLTIGTIYGTLAYSNFMSATEGYMYSIGEHIRRHEVETLVGTVDAGVMRAMQKSFAFICPQPSMEGSLASFGIRNYHFGKEDFGRHFISFAVPNGSPMKEAFGKTFMQLNEMGIIEKLYKDVLAQRERRQNVLRKTNPNDVITDQFPVEADGKRRPRSLRLQELLSAFVVFIVGHILAVLVFLLELGYSHCNINA